ncbi:hypothetical protein MPTK1_2g01260 [Marchantia polymorpha subsp. ruderalis]|uniref:Uncharacterized protein n=1 Tax=Marchantia polymorpha TaxID=3197 RepID=A0A2R6X9B5_MARPO|nr:hypothetical protein MARPO_0028s0026 [Marchantia polymorpha]BBN00696.1 hypothetical protein Mp_2g01260 [Marchantia polymorpha subsp. ruderalis]|eukprot:PTQ42700.1 hypothetical protein MARPO_0028s0026 [Marchantia polymorpha]
MATLQFACCRPALKIVGLSGELVSSSSSCSSGLGHQGTSRCFDLRRVHGKSVCRRRRCGVSIRARGGRKPGESESKQVLDAFFLGKALAETINERVGSAIGEFLSDVGRQQAEQQKKIREFQDEVQERAKAAAAKAAQKAMAAEQSKSISSTSTVSQPPPSTSSLSDPSDAPTTSAAPPPDYIPTMDEDGVITIDE